VCYSDDCALGKLFSDCGLYELVSVGIDGCSGLVQYEYFSLSQQRSGQANELTLANTKQDKTELKLKLKLKPKEKQQKNQ
jgi:hypothetical protein